MVRSSVICTNMVFRAYWRKADVGYYRSVFEIERGGEMSKKKKIKLLALIIQLLAVVLSVVVTVTNSIDKEGE